MLIWEIHCRQFGLLATADGQVHIGTVLSLLFLRRLFRISSPSPFGFSGKCPIRPFLGGGNIQWVLRRREEKSIFGKGRNSHSSSIPDDIALPDPTVMHDRLLFGFFYFVALHIMRYVYKDTCCTFLLESLCNVGKKALTCT